MPVYKSHPEDFVVEEIPLYPPDGEGSHCLAFVEKTGLTTDRLVKDLARLAGVAPRDVGYAGRKDRHALTRQWVSVPGIDAEEVGTWEGPSWRVLEAVPHRQKLRPGHLKANRFALRVADVSADQAERASEVLESAARRGFGNRFGGQRFGRHGGNADKARRLLAGEIRVRDRRLARLLVSALQSEAFNLVLERRREIVPPLPGEEPWQRLLDGDVAQVVRSGGSFRVEDASADQARLAAHEIVVTGPVPGAKALRPTGAVGELERTVCEEVGCLPLLEGRLPRLRIDGARRALAVRPDDARFRYQDGAAHVDFSLPPGSYATVLLEELFGEALREADRREEGSE